MTRQSLIWFVGAAVVISGCAPAADADLSQEPGLDPQGLAMNGTALNGTTSGTVAFAFASASGLPVTAVKLAATQFQGMVRGAPLSGAGFVGTTWTPAGASASAPVIRIDSMSPAPAPNQDLSMYGVSYLGASGWAPLCGLDATGAPVMAIPLGGTWSYGQGVPGGGSFTADPAHFTFACRATAIAKCVELGYRPWETVGGVNLTDPLVACTRLLRADYCGDGTSHTLDGTPLDLYDALGIQDDAATWPVEAEWNATGAACLTPGVSDRYLRTTGPAPACLASKLSSTCGAAAHFATGTLLMDRYQPPVTTPLVHAP